VRKRFFTFCMFLVLAAAIAGPVQGGSPYRLDRSKDGWLAGGSAVAAVGGILVSRTPDPLTAREIDRLSRESVNAFDRGATYRYSTDISRASDVVVGIVAAAPLALLLDSGVRDDWQTCSVMYVETVALAVILPAYGKGTVDRIRPFVYNPDAPIGAKTTSDARKSFFSRHTSAAFASAVFLSSVYGDYHPGSAARPYVWAGSLLAATAVGVMRYESGEHFPTDVIVGAVAGGAVGYLIPRIHRAAGGRLSVRPACPGADSGVTLELGM
jgi:hypothetical protein